MNDKTELGGRVLTNSLFNLVVFGINRAGGLIFTILLVRILKPELWGLYNLALSITLVVLTLANFGIDEALSRYVSKYYKRDKNKARAYFDYLFKLKVSVLISGAIILALASKPLSIFYNTPSLMYPLLISAFYLILMSLSQFLSSLFYAFQKVNWYSIKELVFQISRISLLPLILLFASTFWVSGIFFVMIVASVITLAFSLIVLGRKHDFLFQKGSVEKIDRKEIFHYLKFLTLGSITGILLIYVDVLLLGKFVSLEYVGFYKAASNIILSVIALITITPVLYPIFSQISQARLNQIFNKVAYYTSVISVPATLGIIFVARPFIRAIYGYEYLESVYPLYALAFLIFSFTIGDLFTIALNSHGKSKYTAKSTILATTLNVILNLVFIIVLLPYGERYVIMGAAVATIISRYSAFFVLKHYSKKLLGIKLKASELFKPLIASIVMAAFLVLFNILTAGKLNLFLGILEVGIAVAIYFASLFIIKGISMDEVNYIINIVKRNYLKKKDKTGL